MGLLPLRVLAAIARVYACGKLVSKHRCWDSEQSLPFLGGNLLSTTIDKAWGFPLA
jgi:hypothetical protein